MSDAPKNVDEFLDFLDVGEYDERLEEIRERVEERRALLLKRKQREFSPGDTVVFTSNASPKYLQGLTATYVESGGESKKGNPTAILETPDEPRYKRFGGSKTIKAPLNIIEKKVDP